MFNFVLLIFFHAFEPIVWSGWGHQPYAKAERPLQGGCGLQQSAKPDKFMQEARPNWLKRTQGICIMHTCHLIKSINSHLPASQLNKQTNKKQEVLLVSCTHLIFHIRNFFLRDNLFAIMDPSIDMSLDFFFAQNWVAQIK